MKGMMSMSTMLPVPGATGVLPRRSSNLLVRTGLRGGVCVDVNDAVKAALKTLSDALGGASATAAPVSTDTATTASS